jgi:hypothetical protein
MNADFLKMQSQPRERRLSVSREPPMLSDLEAHSQALQGSRGERLDRVPLPRCARRSAEGKG